MRSASSSPRSREEHDVSKLARAVRDETDGNPFFVVEVVRHLTETGGLVDPGSAPGDVRDLPPSVREVVSQRVRVARSRRGRDARHCRDHRGRRSSSMCSPPSSTSPPEMLVDWLDIAVRARVLREVGARPLRVRPRPGAVHARRRRVATRRRDLHRRIARVLEQLGGRAGPARARSRTTCCGPTRRRPDPKVLEYMRHGGDPCARPARAARRVPVVHARRCGSSTCSRGSSPRVTDRAHGRARRGPTPRG